jgi:thioredoxin reductase (NADPH)
VVVVGGGNSACTTTSYLSGLANQVTVIHRRDAFRAEESIVKDIKEKANVNILFNTEVKEIKGDKQVRSITLQKNDTSQHKRVIG